jgi:putative ABC transport system permease protein
MWRLALKATLAKKLRLFSTALSVVLGIAFLSGTLVFTDTLERTFDDLFANVFDETDAYVRSSESLELGFGETQRGRIPAALVDTVADVEGVGSAQGVVQRCAQMVDADGDPIGDPGNGPPTFAMTFVTGEMSPWQLTPGSRAPGAGEIVVDQASAEKGSLTVGQPMTLLTQTGPHELTLVGTVTFGSVESPGGASVSLLDLATSQALLLGDSDELDAIMVDAASGIDEAVITERIAAVLPDGTEAITGTAITEESQSTMHEAMGFFSTFLLVFAGIGLVVACFTIYNTFQIVVTQRTREMALLRSVGATRTQVLSSQLIEAILVGVVASLVGLAAGVGVAMLLEQLLVTLGIDLPSGGTVLATRTAVVSVVVGTLVTAIAAVFPSLRASRTPPLAAIRDIAVDASASSGRRLVMGAGVSVIGVVAYAIGLRGGQIEWVGVGALATFVGVFMLGPLFARPFSAALGAPMAATVTGSVARGNAMRNPKRTSRTGGALMVGVALVAAITVIAASVKDWTRDSVGELFTGDYVVASQMYGFGGLSPDLTTDIARLDEVAAATGVRIGAAHDLDTGDDLRYVAADPASASPIFELDMVSGTVGDLGETGVLLDDSEADRRGVGIGDHIRLAFLDGSRRALTVDGIYRNDDVVGMMVVHQALHESTGVDQFDVSIFVTGRQGVTQAALGAALDEVAGPYPNAEVRSRSEYIDDQAAQFDQIINLMYALLALAIVIALVNIANSLALSIHERTHELGLLRAVGTTRSQTSMTLLLEALLIAVLGTLVGLVVGTFFGWSISMVGRGMTREALVLPVLPLAVITLAAVGGAVLAAIRPSWRAAHLDVLRAIASE